MNEPLDQKELEQTDNRKSMKEYLKKIGVAGIIFFTVKGIITTFFIFQLGKCAIQ